MLVNTLCSQSYLQTCGTGLDAYTSSVYYDSIIDKLILHGEFNYAGGVSTKGMATWDGIKFDSLGAGDKYSLFGAKTFMITYKNKLYTQFFDKYLYAFDYNTKQWQQIPGQFDANIRDATVHNNELVLVGDFTAVGNISVPYHIIKFNGANYDTIPQPDFTILIWAVKSYKNELYIAGHFDPGAIHLPSNCIAKFNGTEWVAASPGLSISGEEAYTLQIYKNKLFVSGVFDTINGDYSPGIAAWNGVKWFNPGGLNFNNGLPGYAMDMQVIDNRLYLFGSFDSVGRRIKTQRIAVWNDSIWCGSPLILNQGPDATKYKGNWYFSTGPLVYCDTVTPATWTVDTIGYFSKLVGNGGKLDRDCFKTPPVAISVNPEGVYPNPASNNVNFSVRNCESCKLIIFNSLGQKIYEAGNVQSSGNFDMSKYPNGLYFVQFEGSKRQVYRLVKTD